MYIIIPLQEKLYLSSISKKHLEKNINLSKENTNVDRTDQILKTDDSLESKPGVQ